MMKRILSIFLLLTMMTVSFAAAETAQETAVPAVIATVNGAQLTASAFALYEASYLENFMAYGADMTDEAVLAYIQDMALTTAIEDMLVEQDMRAQGSYDFDEETESWLAEQGHAAYETALQNAREMMKESLDLTEEAEIDAAALSYAEELGVSEQTYVDFFHTQYATVMYYDWLNGGAEVTEEEVQAAYDKYVEELKAAGEEIPALDDTLRGQLEYYVYQTRCQELLEARIDALSETAEVVIH